jgi:hypothetical protein
LVTKDHRYRALTRSVERIERHLQTLSFHSRRFSAARLFIAAVGLPLTILAFFSRETLLFWLCFGLTIVSFSVAVWLHRRVKARIAANGAWLSIKQTQIARMTIDWARIPRPRYVPAALHALEIDLDLDRLRMVIDTADSREGSERLRGWLLTTRPDRAVTESRAALVSELKGERRFRDRLSLATALSETDRSKWADGRILVRWLQGESAPRALRPALLMLSALSLLTIITFVLTALDVLPTEARVIWGVYTLGYLSQWRMAAGLLGESHALADALGGLTAVTRHLETYPYREGSRLQNLCAPLVADQPTQQLHAVTRTLSAASLQRNVYLWLMLNAIVPWDLFFIWRLYGHKAQLKITLPRWLNIWHEVEALNSLATYAYLNPQQPFPTLVETARFEAKAIGHPLIPDAEKVPNDFGFEGAGQIAIITGANMAGKSSFLRTLGVNLCMAYAGGTVDAVSLETGLFRVFSCIRVTDSLETGTSYFYAEVKRLKALLDAVQAKDSMPVFYVIDEIFRGTNNRERLIGSRAYIRALLNANGLGLIATHDLELAKLADENPSVRNFHFRETIEDGRMVFDYQLRAGPCPTTNALKVMSLAGLPVEDLAGTL